MMGTTFPTEAFLPAFAQFDAEFTKLAGELPGWMCKDAIRHRDACLDLLERWYIQYSEQSDAANLRAGETVSNVIQAVLDFTRKHGTKTRDVAAFLLADMFATQANAPPAAAWLILKLAENPESIERLRGEIEAGLTQCGGRVEDLLRSKEVMNGPTFGFLTSAIRETLRYVTSVASIRRVMQDTVIGGNRSNDDDGGDAGVQLRKGEMIYCMTRPTHTDSAVHRHAERWIPERFLPEFKAQGYAGKAVRNDMMPFGGGTSMCEGGSSLASEAGLKLISTLQVAISHCRSCGSLW